MLQAGSHRYTVSPTLSFGSSGKGDSLLASVEVGQAFAIAENWRIEPQLQLVHQRVSLDDTGIVGALVQQNSHNGWLVRAGVRVKGEIATSAGLLQPYVRFNVYRSGSGTDITRFVGPAAYTDIATRTGGTSTELAAGGTLQLTESTSLSAELGKLWASGGDTRTKGGVQARLGEAGRESALVSVRERLIWAPPGLQELVCVTIQECRAAVLYPACCAS